MGQLIERDAEIRAVADLLTAVVEGRGGSVVFTGSAGIGRSALALQAHESAQRQGFAVLASNPTPVSPALSYGVDRDWFGPLVRGVRPPARRPAVGPTGPNPPGTGADDANREPTQSPGIIERLSARALTVEPRPFSVHGVALMQTRTPDPAARSLSAQEVHRQTGGLPFLVAEMLRTGGSGATPQPVVDSVRSRLDQLGGVAQQVARTVAALGDEASFDAIGDLTGGGRGDAAGVHGRRPACTRRVRPCARG